MPIPILKLPYTALQCLVQQFEPIDIIHLYTTSKAFSTLIAHHKILVDRLEFRVTDDTFLVKWNDLEMKVWLRKYMDPYGPGVRLESKAQEEAINLKVDEKLTGFEKVQKVLERVLPILVVQIFDFNFCTSLPIRPRDLFIWKISKKFENFSITSSSRFNLRLTPEDFHFFLGEIRAQNLTLDVLASKKFLYKKPLRASTITLGNINWLKLNFQTMMTWDCSTAHFLYLALTGPQMNDFLRTWLRSENVTFLHFQPIPALNFDRDAVFERIRRGEIVEERNVLVSIVGYPPSEGVEKILRRRGDGMEARVLVNRFGFVFEVLEEKEEDEQEDEQEDEEDEEEEEEGDN